MSLPSLNMIGWSILDYELAYDGIRHLNDAVLWLQNQPRAENGERGYYPGADFIIAIGESWGAEIVSEIVGSLREIRFPDPKHEERRLLLLLNYETQWGPASEPLASILAMVAEKSRSAA